VRVLVNESTFLERGSQRLFICGVDDPGYFETDDFGAAFAGVPAGACALVLSHDPGAFRKAAASGAAFMLSGHTHGGQMCLPGGYAPSTHSRCLRKMVSGAWKWDKMCGYTSAGVGGSRVAARYFCDGEVIIHILHQGAK
jgi:predicted MPP superfamily phosphohydrolase